MLKKQKLNIKSVKIEGKGAIILTGPSGCGKGEVANYIFNMFSLDKKLHLSMGQILRDIISRSRSDGEFLNKLSDKYKISKTISIFDENENPKEVVEKAISHKDKLLKFINKDEFFRDKNTTTQYTWLCYAVANGLLVPKEWTNSMLEASFKENQELKNSIFLIDGYPRTIPATRHMLNLFQEQDIPIIKVIHLSITKAEMMRRASLRNREDDNKSALENRFQFYVDQVQPSVDEMKNILGSDCVALVDAHQPVFDRDGEVNVKESIKKVAKDVIRSLDISF